MNISTLFKYWYKKTRIFKIVNSGTNREETAVLQHRS